VLVQENLIDEYFADWLGFYLGLVCGDGDALAVKQQH
jgi:hypothetical protein